MDAPFPAKASLHRQSRCLCSSIFVSRSTAPSKTRSRTMKTRCFRPSVCWASSTYSSMVFPYLFLVILCMWRCYHRGCFPQSIEVCPFAASSLQSRSRLRASSQRRLTYSHPFDSYCQAKSFVWSHECPSSPPCSRLQRRAEQDPPFSQGRYELAHTAQRFHPPSIPIWRFSPPLSRRCVAAPNLSIGLSALPYRSIP